ncbi:MAG: Crp/Fnr family transcriptional regulator [Alphaproteobacteria bacterium]|nr:Crp/Fnr family transcriptional regulator [Alphaproteobacteria bacterium]
MNEAEPVRFKRGDVIWNQGDEADFLMITCSGHLKLTRSWMGDRDPIMGLVHRSQIVGEESALEGAHRTASAIALTRGKGLRLYRDDLLAALQRDPKLHTVLLGLAVDRVQLFSRRMEELGEGSVEHRLARVFLRMGREVGLPDARGTFLPLRLTRGDLADLVGCRVETTIRVMTRWQRDGVVDTYREGFVIRNPGELESFAA